MKYNRQFNIGLSQGSFLRHRVDQINRWLETRSGWKETDVGVVAIDLSKAFDFICHNLLLAKLKANSVQEPALQLIRSNLHDRKQRVICNDSSSNWLPLRCGVPQGSLSPLLFNIFMNDMNETVTVSSPSLYADDNTQYAVANSPFLLQYTLNRDVESISSWLEYNNYLPADGNKTQMETKMETLLIGVNKTLKKKLEDSNHYGLRTIMNMGKNWVSP